MAQRCHSPVYVVAPILTGICQRWSTRMEALFCSMFHFHLRSLQDWSSVFASAYLHIVEACCLSCIHAFSLYCLRHADSLLMHLKLHQFLLRFGLLEDECQSRITRDHQNQRGFGIPLLPNYNATIGAAWLERGGQYVEARWNRCKCVPTVSQEISWKTQIVRKYMKARQKREIGSSLTKGHLNIWVFLVIQTHGMSSES